MAFSVKDWRDDPDHTTPLSAAALEDLETRLSAYTDTGDAGKQPLDTDLSAIAALASAANKMPYSTAAQAWALADLTAFARTLLDDADAATARATLDAPASVDSPTIQELVVSVPITATISATTSFPMFVAMFPLKVVACSFMPYVSIGASDTNYWRVAPKKYKISDGTVNDMASKSTQVTGGEAFTALKSWNYDGATWNTTHQTLAKDDSCYLAFTKTAAPANITFGVATLRYEPL